MLPNTNPLDHVRDLRFPDTPRTRWYCRQIDDDLDEQLGGFALGGLPFGDREEQDVRSATFLTGLMAFCRANRMRCRSPGVFRYVRRRDHGRLAGPSH